MRANSLPFLIDNPYIGDMAAMKNQHTKPTKICQVEGCDKPCSAKGFCRKHYYEYRRDGLLDNPICKVDGCDQPSFSKCLCGRHYNQVRTMGGVRSRTTHDPNEFTVDGDLVRIHLYNKRSQKIGEAIVDASDYHLVSKYRWSLLKTHHISYCSTSLNRKTTYIHRIIMGEPDSQVDHINRDGLLNSRSNLRLCTQQQNVFNSGMQSNNKSGYKGVFWSTSAQVWMARIQKNGKIHCLGVFAAPEVAAIAYNDAARHLFGEFAYLNDV